MEHNPEELRKIYISKKNEIDLRLSEFKKFRSSSDEKIFYELCYCVITAHGSARAGRKAQACLERNDFFGTGKIGNCLDGVRYRNNKKKFLLENRKNIIGDKISLREYLSGYDFALREKVAKDSRHFKGLGWKASSQFLRNIGFNGLAILDRHILKSLKEHGVISEIPKSLTRKKYLEIEKQMQEFSKKTGVPMDALDIVFWTERSGANVSEAK